MNSVTHLEEIDVSPLVNDILERIHGDKFWDILEELVVNVVNKRLVAQCVSYYARWLNG